MFLDEVFHSFQWFHVENEYKPWIVFELGIREVLLQVKRERVRVTSDSGAQICYMSRSRTL